MQIGYEFKVQCLTNQFLRSHDWSVAKWTDGGYKLLNNLGTKVLIISDECHPYWRLHADKLRCSFDVCNFCLCSAFIKDPNLITEKFCT